MQTEKFTMTEMIEYYPEPGLDEKGLYAILKEFGIVDETNRPIQKYVDEGYLELQTSLVEIDGENVQVYETLAIGYEALDFLVNILDKIFYPADKVIYITAKKKKKGERRKL